MAMMVFLFIIVFIIISVLQRYGKRHEKALGKARKSGAEGINMKLVSEFYSIIPLKVMSKYAYLRKKKLPKYLELS